ncbi:hypothetical protein KVR01_013288 [Diaporthe batatas]|uniref:uncharacterized protein n=1 Tax=Diaporthe batatas TaxID=748121 RepID=UPI001D0514F7|nr:uncharacterized protein KVR01_013288 [Diaporthe batatas]KAG8156875.1 hypothetical protein KVR01_013288 [Diaporthe batatas]
MPKPPLERFKIGEEVVNRDSRVKGKVTDHCWMPHLHSHTYTYRCEFVTDELKGQNTVWLNMKTPHSRTSPEWDLEKAGD